MHAVGLFLYHHAARGGSRRNRVPMPTEIEDALAKAKAEWEAEKEEELKGIKANRDEALKQKVAANKRLADLEAKLEGVDLEKYAELEKLEADRRDKEIKAKGDVEELRKHLEDKHAKVLKQAQDKYDRVLGALEESLCKRAVVTELAKHTREIDLLLPHALKDVKMVERDGEFVAEVRNPDGPDTVEAYVLGMKDRFPAAFPASGEGGDGAKGGSGNARGVTTIEGDNDVFMANIEKIAKGEVLFSSTE